MDELELNAILQENNEEYQNQWNQTRFGAYVYAASQTDKIKKPSDIIKFPWDDDKEVVEIPEDIEQRKVSMFEDIKKLNEKWQQENTHS